MAALLAPLLLLAGGGVYLLRGQSQGTPPAPEPVHSDPQVPAQPPAAALPPAQPPAVTPPSTQPPAVAQLPQPQEPVPASAQPRDGGVPSPAPASSEDDDAPSEEPAALGKSGADMPAHGEKPAPRGSNPSAVSAGHKAQRVPGRLQIITTRRGESYWATVLVDGERKGTTPLTLELAPGPHRLRVERIGFRAVEQQIRVAPGRRTVLRIPLVP